MNLILSPSAIRDLQDISNYTLRLGARNRKIAI
jgi:plasmid stabilization system protein ParE